ncbi:unnamed protein product, partial [Rotaria sp. Silwood2]
AQGRWYELLSPTQVLTGQQQNLDNNNEKEPKKKKRHGNRKQQHQRRRLRRQQHKQNNTTTNHTDQRILIVIDDTDDNPEENNEEQPIQQDIQNNQHRTGLKNKRKRQESNEDDIQVSRSFSQLSISQRNRKKTKSTPGNNSSNNEISNVVTDANEKLQQQNEQEENNELLSTNYVKQFKPSYLKVSDKIFKRILSNSIEDGNEIVQCLNTNEKLQFVRQMAETTNNLYYFDLQCQLWQDYFDLGMKENKWAPRVSKSFAKHHHTCRTYGFPKHIVEQRLRTIGRQFQRTINELQQYITQLEHNVEQWQPYIHPAILSNAINECVKSAQQRLRQEFEHRRKMLESDSNDRHLLTKFYELQPNEEQIHVAKMIWQTAADELKTIEQEEILRKRIFLKRLPSGIDHTINQSIDYTQCLLSNPHLNKDRRASSISSCSKTIAQFKFDLMSLNLGIIEDIRRGHQQLLIKLQDKLMQSNCAHSDGGIKRMKKQVRRRRSNIFIYKTITASSPFIEVNLNLTPAQMSMLINGFKYIIPCQSRLCSRQSIDQIINEQYQKISSIVKDCLNDHRIPIANERTIQIFSVLERILHEFQSQKLSKILGRRAQYEHKIMRSIQRLIHRRKDIVVRRTDKNKVFYIGKALDFECKAEEYMLKTEAYEEITNGHCPLADNLHSVQTLLNYLLTKHALTKKQCNYLSPNLNNLELGHYHGLPKPHKPGTPLRPIIACIHAPATLASKFLNDLLAPIYLKFTRKYTFINDIDVIRKLEQYAANGYLIGATKFITIDVENLYTMRPRQG